MRGRGGGGKVRETEEEEEEVEKWERLGERGGDVVEIE